MLVKRLILLVVSMAVGYGVTLGLTLLIDGMSIEKYGFYYTLFTTISFGLAVGIWLDKFMGTDILKK